MASFNLTSKLKFDGIFIIANDWSWLPIEPDIYKLNTKPLVQEISHSKIKGSRVIENFSRLFLMDMGQEIHRMKMYILIMENQGLKLSYSELIEMYNESFISALGQIPDTISAQSFYQLPSTNLTKKCSIYPDDFFIFTHIFINLIKIKFASKGELCNYFYILLTIIFINFINILIRFVNCNIHLLKWTINAIN